MFILTTIQTDRDVRTQDGWETFLERNRNLFPRLLENQGALSPQVVLLIQRNITSGQPVKPPHMDIMSAARGFPEEAGDHGEGAKRTFFRFARIRAVAGDAIASLFAHEAWYAHRDQVRASERVSDAADRKEAIILVASHRTFGQSTHVCPFKRDDGQFFFDEWRSEGEPHLMNADMRIIYDDPPTEEHQEEARRVMRELSVEGRLTGEL